MTGFGHCLAMSYGEEMYEEANTFTVEGAATLVAGATIVALAMSI